MDTPDTGTHETDAQFIDDWLRWVNSERWLLLTLDHAPLRDQLAAVSQNQPLQVVELDL